MTQQSSPTPPEDQNPSPRQPESAAPQDPQSSAAGEASSQPEQSPSGEQTSDRGEQSPKESKRPPIQIGSRRGMRSGLPQSKPQLAGQVHQDDSGESETATGEPSAESPAGEAAPARPQESPEKSGPTDRKKGRGEPKTANQPGGRVEIPNLREPLSDDLEKQLAEAVGDSASLEEMMTGGAAEHAGRILETDERVRAQVVKIHGENVFFSLGVGNEGIASLQQFEEPPEVGKSLEVVVAGYNSEDELYEVRVPGASIEVSDWADLDEGAVVSATITGSNTGGLEAQVGGIRGFIPASQIGLHRVENFGDYVNQKLQCVVTEANPRRRNLVLSHRAILEREQEEQRKKLMESLAPGQVHEGVVRNIRDFGAFIDLGGVDGLVHVSQLSWDRVNHPSDVLEEGQRVKVKVEKVNPETGKISLSLRNLQENPWDRVEEKYPRGATVKGEVTRIANFGAFVRLEAGVEGLIHISEVSHGRIYSINNFLKEGQDVEVKVTSVDRDAQRIGLSLKATLAPPQQKQEKKSDEELADETPRELAVPQREGPLKGGTDRPSGGEQFGLKW